MSKITKNALSASLKKLLLQKPFDKITVTDITEDCGLNRMTFYYHFQDIYDLLEWTCQEDARKYLKNKKTYDTWQEGYLNIFYGALENKEFILNVYRCVVSISNNTSTGLSAICSLVSLKSGLPI